MDLKNSSGLQSFHPASTFGAHYPSADGTRPAKNQGRAGRFGGA